MKGFRTGKVASFRMLDHVDFADQVGDGHIRSGQFFGISAIAANPFDGSFVASGADQLAGHVRYGCQWVVVDLRARHNRNGIVQQVDQLSQKACFGLSTQTQQKDVVAGEYGVLDLRKD